MEYARKAINELLEKYTQEELANILDEKQPNISAFKNGNRSVSKKARSIMVQKFGYDNDLMFSMSNDDFLAHMPEPEARINPTVKDIKKVLKKVDKKAKSQKENAKDGSGERIIKQVKLIPEKAAMGLVSHFFDSEYVDQLETELIEVSEYFNETGYKVDAVGESMYDGTSRSLLDGDKYLAKEIRRAEWGSKLINGGSNLFYFLHKERGHLIKEVTEHNTDSKEMTLHSWNPDKKQFPDFKIKVDDCYIIASIEDLLYRRIKHK